MRKPPSAGGYAAGRDEHSRQQGGGKGGKGGRDGRDSLPGSFGGGKGKGGGSGPGRPPPPGIDPSIGDWRCPSCDNWNWARRFDVPCLRHLRLSSKAYLPCAHHGFFPASGCAEASCPDRHPMCTHCRVSLLTSTAVQQVRRQASYKSSSAAARRRPEGRPGDGPRHGSLLRQRRRCR